MAALFNVRLTTIHSTCGFPQFEFIVQIDAINSCNFPLENLIRKLKRRMIFQHWTLNTAISWRFFPVLCYETQSVLTNEFNQISRIIWNHQSVSHSHISLFTNIKIPGNTGWSFRQMDVTNKISTATRFRYLWVSSEHRTKNVDGVSTECCW